MQKLYTKYTLYTFIKCLNTVVWPACNQPVMVKLSLPLFTSPRGKSPTHLWHCPVNMDTILSEKLRSASAITDYLL